MNRNFTFLDNLCIVYVRSVAKAFAPIPYGESVTIFTFTSNILRLSVIA